MSAILKNRVIFTAVAMMIVTSISAANDGPRQTCEEQTKKNAVSVIPIEVEVDVDALKSVMEENLPTEERERGIYWTTGERVGCCFLQFGIHRSGPVSVSVTDNALLWTVPLAINNGRVDWSKKVLIVTVRHHEEFGGNFRISAVTRVDFDDDWSVESDTKLHFDYIDRPWITIHAGPFRSKISIGSKVGDYLNTYIHEIMMMVDDIVESRLISVDTRKLVQGIWRDAHQIIDIPSVDASLRVCPTELRFGGLESGPDDTIVAVLEIEAYLEIEKSHEGDAAEISELPLAEKASEELDVGVVRLWIEEVVGDNDAHEYQLITTKIVENLASAINFQGADVVFDVDAFLSGAALGREGSDEIRGRASVRVRTPFTF